MNAISSLLEDDQGMGASASQTGLSQAEPEVSALTGFDPSRKAELLLQRIVDATHSHVDGRDLLAELHPRKTLDIKRRVDGVETWFEGDWLSNVNDAVKEAKAFLYSRRVQREVEERGERQRRMWGAQEAAASAIEARSAETTGSARKGESATAESATAESRDAQGEHP